MTYTIAVLVGVASALVLDVVVLRTRLVRRAIFWATYPLILVFQLIANGVLTGRQVVRYAPDAILGPRLAYAPIEDIGFGFALVLVTLSVWVWLGRRGLERQGVDRHGVDQHGVDRQGVDRQGMNQQSVDQQAGR